MGRGLRYSVEPKDVSPEKAARRLGLGKDQFEELLPRLLSRGFPAPDLDTGNFDLDEIDAWRARRHRPLSAAAGQEHSTGLATRRLAALVHGSG